MPSRKITTRIAAHREQRLQRGPEHLGEDDVVELDRRVEDAFPGLLDLHPRVRRVERLEGRGQHRADRHAARGEVLDVGPAADLPDQRAEPIAERDQRDQRLGDVADDARHGELLPDQQVAQHDRPEARRDAGCGVERGQHGVTRRRGSVDRSASGTDPQGWRVDADIAPNGPRPAHRAAAWPRAGRRTPSRRSSRPARRAEHESFLPPQRPRRRPRRHRSRGARRSARAASPSAILRPWSSTIRRSQRRSASSMKWVVSRIALPCCSRFCRRSHMRWRACGSRPVVGSSSTSRSGSLISARPRLRRRLMPPDSSPGLTRGLGLQRRELEQLRNPRFDRRGRQPEVAAVDAQVLGAGEIGVEAVGLRDDADPLLGGSHLRGNVEAERRDAAGVGRGETEAHADRRRLAGAVRADHAEAFAGHGSRTTANRPPCWRRTPSSAPRRATAVRSWRIDSDEAVSQTRKGQLALTLCCGGGWRRPIPRPSRRRPPARAGRPARRTPSARCRRRGSPSSGCACSRRGAPCSAGRARRTAC